MNRLILHCFVSSIVSINPLCHFLLFAFRVHWAKSYSNFSPIFVRQWKPWQFKNVAEKLYYHSNDGTRHLFTFLFEKIVWRCDLFAIINGTFLLFFYSRSIDKGSCKDCPLGVVAKRTKSLMSLVRYSYRHASRSSHVLRMRKQYTHLSRLCAHHITEAPPSGEYREYRGRNRTDTI